MGFNQHFGIRSQGQNHWAMFLLELRLLCKLQKKTCRSPKTKADHPIRKQFQQIFLPTKLPLGAKISTSSFLPYRTRYAS